MEPVSRADVEDVPASVGEGGAGENHFWIAGGDGVSDERGSLMGRLGVKAVSRKEAGDESERTGKAGQETELLDVEREMENQRRRGGRSAAAATEAVVR